MVIESEHRESWHLTIVREDTDSWPDIEIGQRVKREMRPERIDFTLNRGSDYVPMRVKGRNYLKNGQPGNRDEYCRRPHEIPWVLALVQETRERTGLGPGATGVDWA
jgi:hypothetical protein